MKLYQWDRIDEIPKKKPGIYAWYYSPEITDRDIEKMTGLIQSSQISEEAAMSELHEEVKSFLHERIFKYFQEEPYEAYLKGPLKPQYSGQIEHLQVLTNNLIERIIRNPSRLTTIRQIIEASCPLFASPIYIGMSKTLGQRVSKHKSLIKQIREKSTINYQREINHAEEQGKKDQSFALQVCRRKLIPTRLSVAATVMEVSDREYVDVENILNRVCYPVLGRN
ncbi:hypothetical protein [Leptolyngbya iicbica]|uniref:GIY-YIG domain-containing protein n=2 Tax=Cyanophyceae TaxID=3028117 RepID=A0A4V2E2I2_9CYAN|nr:hypothetical protein [Leptolyngbya sp. LK]RZM78646.1 hypothetical protein DYY88_07530 [Leptolyngbya sp. LK]